MGNDESASQPHESEDDGATLDATSLAALLADLRFLAQENGRLRAERDLIRAERDRLASWIETDRELTHRMLTALEADLRALRASSVPPAATPAPADGAATGDPGPSLRTGIGRRFRERMSDAG